MEPPNTDIFHVQDNLKEILSYFKNCEKISSDIPLIKVQVRQINDQGLKFHACLQQSIAQSNKLGTHAESVMNYIEVLNDPIFDSTRILNVLKSLLENTRKNMEETEKIRDDYSAIRDKLIEINDQRYTQDSQDNERVKSLPKKKENFSNLEGDRKIMFRMIFILIIIGLILLAIDIENHPYRDRGGFFIVMILISGTTFLYLRKQKFQIKKFKDEILELEALEKQLKILRNEIDTKPLCEKMHHTIIQVAAFNTYWLSQYHILESLNKSVIKNEGDNLENNNTLADQVRAVLKGPMKNRWEQVKTHCDNYTRTVRRLIVEA